MTLEPGGIPRLQPLLLNVRYLWLVPLAVIVCPCGEVNEDLRVVFVEMGMNPRHGHHGARGEEVLGHLAMRVDRVAVDSAMVVEIPVSRDVRGHRFGAADLSYSQWPTRCWMVRRLRQ